ncbi:MAG: D-glycero-beta-D-manno-heptose-7-phosphate kinase [Calditrichaeota bacterium]|nr:D-glycero-beta-D-manno-heptose-7-phosphate kinase [Calditrichota bacterium]
MHLSKQRVNELLDQMKSKHIAVIGDLMLDEYLIGRVERISPEAPVPVVNVKKETLRLGGAANVCLNLSSLGLKVTAFGVTGDDSSANDLRHLLNESGISDAGLIDTNQRITTKKTRIIGENQQIVRIDRENTKDISHSEVQKLIEKLRSVINSLDAIILQDYNKGVITADLIKEVIEFGKQNDKPVFVDPKFNNFFAYQEVTLFKPNLRESSIALNRDLNSMDDFRQACVDLKKQLKADHVLVTLSADGMLLLDSSNEFFHVPTKAVEVADVSGAGDTVISTLAAAYISGADMKESVILANDAAGIVVTELGIVPILPSQLRDTAQ